MAEWKLGVFWNQVLLDLSLSPPVFYGTWQGSLLQNLRVLN